ncbi:catechol 2,3-dioxygenase-like lactoylglutathione lyase family enzyme [Aliiruegeria haliotis]|uniref:Catechol 2,3-dioxygenase-like lactoylglutathione lyase family enzyme n=1 Tax=Aliiruegeria haliotis TaxID=1280846 RepID=A0A2T0RJX7_9RHOB|nr:VOC family protein [Aliiruegeria haliotis]PRY21479.1 catechol 2,3-dioxygenase-like lactoylglutathione lyase family enzyme [Aliiruegeria haliotis]
MQVLAAVSIVVPDYDDGIAFFVGKLGWDVLEDIDQGRKRWVVVAPAGGQCRVVLARAETEAQRAAIGNQTGGRVGFFLNTDDFTRDHAAMVAAGVAFHEDPRQEPYGTVAVWEDAFGNLWDLIEPAEAG